MTNYTHNNHLKYSIGGRVLGYRQAPTEKYAVWVGQVDPDRFLRGSYTEELLRTARLINAEFGSELVVFVSGGTDSEIVLRNFVAIGKRPRCVMIRFKDDYNLSDVIEAQALCVELDIPLEFIEFDVKDFFYSGAASEFGQKLQCTQLTYLMVYECIRRIGQPAVMGGEVLLTRQVKRDSTRWYYTLRENEDASAMRFSEQFQLPLVNEYFSYTPELLLHYLEHPDIQRLVTAQQNFKLTSVSSKNDILKKLQPAIREKKKTHGFEKLLGFNFEAYRGIAANQISRLESNLDGIYFDEIVKMLKGSHDDR